MTVGISDEDIMEAVNGELVMEQVYAAEELQHAMEGLPKPMKKRIMDAVRRLHISARRIATEELGPRGLTFYNEAIDDTDS